MSKSLTKVKEHSKSITHNTAGDILADYLVKGAPTMMGWITALSAYLWSSIPLWLAITIGSAVFLLLSFALYFIARRRVLLVEETHDESSTDLQASQPSIETLTTQHQSEIERLQKNNTALEIDIDLRRQELSNYAWLHEMANAQAKDIDKYVIVERVFLCELRLTDPIQIPYVEFWLDIINTSVYDITVHTDTIEGRIKFQLNNLLEGKEIIFPYESIPPSSRGNVNIKQRLNPTEVSLLAPYENKREEALPLFNLDDLGIVISGGTQFPQVERKYLTIPHITGSQDTAQLKAEPTLKVEILEALYRG
jgi:hypothetical protein